MARRLAGPPPRWQVWSPSGPPGADPGCTGRLAFEKRPCYIADVRMAPPHVGLNRFAVKLVSKSKRDLSGRLSAFLNFHSGRSEVTHFKVKVAAGQSRWYTVYQPVKQAGSARLALALYPRADAEPCSSAIRTHFDVAPVVALGLSPPYCITGRQIQGTLGVHLDPPRGPTQRTAPGPLAVRAEAPESGPIEITFTLRRQGSRRRVHTQSIKPPPSPTYSVQMPTAELRPGRYELDAKVTLDGKTKGTATCQFVTFDDF